MRDQFAADYKTEFGKAPGAYSAVGYACAQVIIAGIAEGRRRRQPRIRRPSARRSAPTPRPPGNTFDTVLGSISFDKNGDTTTPFMSFYKTDLTLAGGKGDWIYVKQQAFTDPNA